MNRNKEISDKTKRRIQQVRDYGIVMLIRKLMKLIKRITYNRKKLMSAFDNMAEKARRGADEAELLAAAREYDISSSKMQVFENKIDEIAGDVAKKSGNKIMDSNGKKLSLDTPSYDRIVSEMRERGFRYVKNVTKKQREKMAEVVSKGFEQGKSIGEMRDGIINEVKHVSKYKAETIARTETQRAVASGMETTLEQNSIYYYNYVTAADSKVSEICNLNSTGDPKGQGKLIDHPTGKGPLPVQHSHPNCRCVIVASEQ